MNSLRWRLIVSLWIALIAMGSGFAVLTYWQQRHEADALLDYQMEQIADFLSAPSFVSSVTTPVAPKISLDHDTDDDFIVTVRSNDGRPLYVSHPQFPLPLVTQLGFLTLDLGGIPYRMYSGRSGDRHILIAQQIETRREVGRTAVVAAVLPLVMLTPLLGLIIAVVVRRQLKSLHAAAIEIAQRPGLALSPLPTAGIPSEVQPLVDEINRLLMRLRDAVEHERRFIADAAHALRTPLAALQLQADVLDGAHNSAQYAERVADLKAGIRRTARLTHHLLALARGESGAAEVCTPIDADTALVEIADNYRLSAAVRGIELIAEARTNTDIALAYHDLALVVGNLLDNALRYSPASGIVSLHARTDAEWVAINVIDEGPGLPDSELPKVFGRFYRVSGDRTEGSGLGLAAVKSIVEKAGGTVELANRSDRSGLQVRLRLPRAGARRPAR